MFQLPFEKVQRALVSNHLICHPYICRCHPHIPGIEKGSHSPVKSNSEPDNSIEISPTNTVVAAAAAVAAVVFKGSGEVRAVPGIIYRWYSTALAWL